MKNKSLIIYLTLASLIILFAIFSPLLTPFDPYEQDLSKALSPPDDINLLGTDRYGRDVLSRVIIGSQNTICSSILLVLSISIFGSFIGAICAYRGGVADVILMRLSDLCSALPNMIFAIAVAGILGGGLFNAVLALALIAWSKYARLSRALTLSLKNMSFIHSAKMSGANHLQMLFHHVFPNIVSQIFVTAVLDLGTIIMELAALSFLGLGAMPPSAEWGAMMNNGRSMLQTAPWVILSPGFAIFLTVAIFNLLADKIRDVMEVSK